MSTIIVPTIGRIVWYWPHHDSDTGFSEDSKQPCAAQIIFVHDIRKVNLLVTDHHGEVHVRTKTALYQDGDEPQAGISYASWMPYQVGQAKAHGSTS
jgi:hypothetical protein